MRSGYGRVQKLKHEDKIPGLLRVDHSKLKNGRSKTHEGMEEMIGHVKERTGEREGGWTRCLETTPA